MRKHLVALTIAAALVFPATATLPSPAAALIIHGAPVEYCGRLADLNAHGVVVDWRSADEGGVLFSWRSDADGRVTTYRVANPRVSFRPTAGGFIIVGPADEGIIWC
jgi:hypothetical protein